MNGGTKANLLIAQGGGPTAVINCSLYGAIRQAMGSPRIDGVLGARCGITGVLRESFVDIRTLSRDMIESLRRTPGAALGSCRHKVTEEDYPRILEVFRRYEIRYFFYIGGNDSMDTACKVDRLARNEGYELFVIGIPKTMDNDLPLTDRCPGYGSAARYVAQSVRDLGSDVRSLPTPVSIFETMGRDAGWVAAASALAKAEPDDAPHLIYLPERPFDPERFLGDVDSVVRRLGWAVVVVSEGIRLTDGQPVYAFDEDSQRDTFGHVLAGDVAPYLAALVSRTLKLRCRSEKPGLLGRSSILHVSPVDQQDALQVGRDAVDAALGGHSGEMVTLLPCANAAEPSVTGLAALAQVANGERRVPDDWIAESGTFVTKAFCDYARPLIGPGLSEYVRLI
jgi:6-phosphofructokinase